MKKATYFISYCHKNIDWDSLGLLVDELKQSFDGHGEVLWDKDLDSGDRFSVHEKQIAKADGVLVILTPSYYQRIRDQQPGGAYREFKLILERYDKEQKRLAELTNSIPESNIDESVIIFHKFKLHLITFAGSADAVVPDELKDFKVSDFRAFKALHDDRKKIHYIRSETLAELRPRIKRMAAGVLQMVATNDPVAVESFSRSLANFGELEDPLRHRILEDLKHEALTAKINQHAEHNAKSILDKLFVKTTAYRKVEGGSRYILIGRKGSGKTSIVHHLAEEYRFKYETPIDISVDYFDLSIPFTLLTNHLWNSDTQHVKTRVRVLETIWELFLILCLMRNIIWQKPSGNDDASLREIEKQLSVLSAKFNVIDEEWYPMAFAWAFATVTDFVKSVPEKSKGVTLAEFASDLTYHQAATFVVSSILGEKICNAIWEAGAVRHQRFLVSFDKFDRQFEEFRRQTLSTDAADVKASRIAFELDWLRSFLGVTYLIKSGRRKETRVWGNIWHKLDFCVMVPHDRYSEIQYIERDAVVYIDQVHHVCWSAIELALMLRKRLEAYSNYSAKKNDTLTEVRDSLDEILVNKFPHIPGVTETMVDGRKYRQHIFLDILRHSFWRPREILVYFFKIDGMLKVLRTTDNGMIAQAVSRCISDTTREIVHTEFMGEYRRHWENIEEGLRAFRGAKQILSMSQLVEILDTFSINVIGMPDYLKDFKSKCYFLIQIGFLGLRLEQQQKNKLRTIFTDVFYFYERPSLFELLAGRDYFGCEFIVHPIFCEHLDLDTSNQSMVCEFGWNELQLQEDLIVRNE